MDFALSPRAVEYQERLLKFMDEHIYPAEQVYAGEMAAADTRTSTRRCSRS